MAGLYLNHTTDLGRFNMTVLADALGEHYGQSASASYTYDLKYMGWYINPSAGVTWQSADTLNHWYGVSQTEVTPQRQAYQADDQFGAFFSLRGRYEISEHWDINVIGGGVYVGTEVEDSPIVDENTLYFVGATINYNF